MNQNFFSSIVQNLASWPLSTFGSIIIQNQVLPASNFLVTKFSFGGTNGKSLNNVVRMAEVNDGVILKLPVIPAVKVPFTVLRSVQIQEDEKTIKLQISFHEDGVPIVSMSFPTEFKGQIPFLLQQVGNENSPSPIPTLNTQKLESVKDDIASWTIQKQNTETKKNPPLQLDNIDIGGIVRIIVLALVLWQAVSYLFRYYGQAF
jgi:hypothetical protein